MFICFIVYTRLTRWRMKWNEMKWNEMNVSPDTENLTIFSFGCCFYNRIKFLQFLLVSDQTVACLQVDTQNLTHVIVHFEANIQYSILKIEWECQLTIQKRCEAWFRNFSVQNSSLSVNAACLKGISVCYEGTGRSPAREHHHGQQQLPHLSSPCSYFENLKIVRESSLE